MNPLPSAYSRIIIMDLINQIRRKNGCDEAMLLRAQNDPDIYNTIQELQGNASRALDR
jgi:hypothetical protein